MIARAVLSSLALILSGAACAQDAYRCPMGSTAISIGAYMVPSCVGSSMQGLVEQIAPFSSNTLFGIAPADREAKPLFTLPDRPPVQNGPTNPRPLGHIAAASTSLSALGDPAMPGVSPKLASDWAFLFEGPQVPPGARLAWMGGFLFRDARGELFFSTSFVGGLSMSPYRHDISGFLARTGPATARLLSARYDTGAYAGAPNHYGRD